MSALQTLRSLIRILQSDERKVVRTYLHFLDSRGDAFDNKSVRLFDYLCRERELAKDREVEAYIYGKREGYAWPRLLQRVRDRILDALCLPVNTARGSLFDERSRKLFRIWRKQARAQFLTQRNCPELADLEIEEILELSQEIEAWEERLTALKLRIEMLHQWKVDLKRLMRTEQLEAELWDCKRILSQSCVAEMLLDRIEEQSLQTDTPLYDAMITLVATSPNKRSIAMQIDYEQIKGYEYAVGRNMPEKAVECFFAAQRLIKKHPLVKPQGYEGLIGVRLGEMLLQQRRFHHAFDEAQAVLPLLERHPFAAINAHEIMFFSKCYMANFHAAREVLEVYDSKFPLNTAQRYCWFAGVNFAIGDFNRAEEAIVNMLAAKPKRKLTTYMQLLALMVAMECGEENEELYEEVERRFHSIKAALSIDHEKQPREAAILELLSHLRKHHFSFIETHKAKSALLEKLCHDPELKWRFRSDELVPFEAWFLIKVTKQDRNKGMRLIRYR